MPLIYITGNSGAGKSSVAEELRLRGYEAHDTDENDISSWQHHLTGEPAERPDNEKDRTEAWYATHDWNMSRSKIETLAKRARHKTVFLCGATSNADKMFDLFDAIYYLVTDKATLQKRLAHRTNNDYGKAPDELKNILGWHESLENSYKDNGASLIDATKPLREVVDDILAHLA